MPRRGNYCRAVLGGALLASIFLLPAPVRGDEVIPRLRSYLEPALLRRGEETLLTVEVSWSGGPTELTFEAPPPPLIPLLQLIETRKKSLAYYREGELRQVRQYLFAYRALKKGIGRIPASSLTYQRPGKEKKYSLSGEPLKVEVTGALSARRWLPRLILLAVILAGAFYYIRWTVRRYRRRSRELIEEYRQDLEEEGLRELGLARKLKVEGDMEGYLARIEKVLSSYLEKKYSRKINRENRTDRLPLTPSAQAALIEIFDLLEKARFGRLPEEERERELILKKVRGFLEERKKMNESSPPAV